MTARVATDARSYVNLREIGGLFYLDATVAPGVDARLVESALREELERFLANGLTAQELQRLKTNYRTNFVRSIERVGGFGGKSDLLAQGEIYGDGPNHYRQQLEWVDTANADDLKSAAQRWLSDGVYILTVLPYDEGVTTTVSVDRSTGVPVVGEPPAAEIPRGPNSNVV